MPCYGSCLCGQVKIELDATPNHHYTCHCMDCRQSCGSAMSTNFICPTEKIKITGPVKEYSSRVGNGNLVMRTFCQNCGSAVAHALVGLAPNLRAVQTGNFPDFAKIPITDELFVKDRWPGLASIPGAKQIEGMPEMDFIERAVAVE